MPSFYLGEFTLRDFEIIICGNILSKADIYHMEKYPGLFVISETHVPFKWDLSDFEEKLRKLLNDVENKIEITMRA